MDFLEEEFNEILNIFSVESEEIISRLNTSLLDLEKKPNNKDAILLLFRDAHSLKGAARMIGFNNVQTIAHKVEDILGLAKDNELHLNAKIVDILYKTIDFLSDLIQKSVLQKQEIYTEEIPNQISILENIKDFAGEITNEDDNNEQNNFDVDLLAKNMENISNLLAESLFYLMNIEVSKDEELIKKLLKNIEDLYNVFHQIGLFDIKKDFEDIKVKLDFVCKVSSNLTESESEGIQQILNNIIIELTSICEIQNIETVDFYSLAFGKASIQPKCPPVREKIEEPEEKFSEEIIEQIEPEIKEIEYPQEEIAIEGPCNQKEVVCDLSSLKDKFMSLSQGHNFLKDIKEYLLSFQEECSNTDVRVVIDTIIKTLDFVGENQIKLDEDSILALLQGINYCDNKIKNKDVETDRELIIQQLEIVQQVLELKTEQTEDFTQIYKKDNPIKNNKIADFSKIFDTGEIKTLRVDSSKLDGLVNQIGELIITKIKTKKHLHELDSISKDLEEWQRNSLQTLNYLKYYDKKYFSHSDAMDNPVTFFVKQLLNIFVENNKNFQDMISSVSGLYRGIQEDDMKMNLIVDDLEHMVKNIRVLPLATAFHLFGRMVRDIAQEKNKQIELEIIGSETSADKKVIEEIKTPLIHIIRNAIDHGIETPDERIALGKNPVGKIVLKAYPVGNNIMIEIQDDGKGINIEKIKEKAISKGYLTQEEINSMSDEELTNIIFAPGFSTGDEITNISGRGIGLDVVHSKISQLNGKVRVISEINKGCCVQIELPTTMSTMKAFLVKSSEKTFAVPMTTINTVVWKKADEIFSNKNSKSIIFNEKTIPIYYLSDILNLPRIKLDQKRETILIIENENKLIGLAVDKLIGDQEVLHKKLSAPLYRLKNISGITTLASGEICLILNMSDMLKSLSVLNVAKLPTQPPVQQITHNNEDYKILVVDDSVTTRTLEKNILTKAGYRVETATSPIDAFQKMKYSSFDLIISDIEMPEMNGFDFLVKLKTDEMYFDIPVIMVSSLMNEGYKKKAAKLGAKAYIIKGEFNQDELLAKIHEILG